MEIENFRIRFEIPYTEADIESLRRRRRRNQKNERKRKISANIEESPPIFPIDEFITSDIEKKK